MSVRNTVGGMSSKVAVPNLAVMRKLNRDRVLEFEAELKEKLQILVAIEKQIHETGIQRKEWLNNISNTYQTESEVHNKMVEVIKAEYDLASLHLKIDLLRLEGQYEDQKLQILMEATRPLEEEETLDERDISLKIKARQNSDVLCAALEQSLETRLKLMDHVHELHTTLLKVNAQAKAEVKTQVDDVKNKLDTYKTRMQLSAQKSQQVYNKILREYLILRHNAHVAEEILQRSQTDAAQARSELQSCLHRLLEEAKNQKDRVVIAAEKELTLQTVDLRTEVMQKEHELEEVMMRVKKLQHQRKNELQDLRNEIRKYDQRYVELQKKRKEDLITVNGELSALRELISHKQRSLQDGSQHGGSRIEEAAEALTQLRQLFDHLQLQTKQPCKTKKAISR